MFSPYIEATVNLPAMDQFAEGFHTRLRSLISNPIAQMLLATGFVATRLEGSIQSLKDETHEMHRILSTWAQIAECEGRYLRVILLPDGETVHNAFFDRGF